jgi:hypothetical protein
MRYEVWQEPSRDIPNCEPYEVRNSTTDETVAVFSLESVAVRYADYLSKCGPLSCKCGHAQESHERDSIAPCEVQGCDCKNYTPARIDAESRDYRIAHSIPVQRTYYIKDRLGDSRWYTAPEAIAETARLMSHVAPFSGSCYYIVKKGA